MLKRVKDIRGYSRFKPYYVLYWDGYVESRYKGRKYRLKNNGGKVGLRTMDGTTEYVDVAELVDKAFNFK